MPYSVSLIARHADGLSLGSIVLGRYGSHTMATLWNHRFDIARVAGHAQVDQPTQRVIELFKEACMEMWEVASWEMQVAFID